jgi:hypothetical protein
MPPKRKPDPNVTCEVVIFPGVRYERKATSGPQGPQAKPPRRRAR